MACSSKGLFLSTATPARPSAVSRPVTLCRAPRAVPFITMSVFVSTRSAIAAASVPPGRGAPARSALSRTASPQPPYAAAVSRP